MFAVLDWMSDPWPWLAWAIPTCSTCAAIITIIIIVALTEDRCRSDVVSRGAYGCETLML